MGSQPALAPSTPLSVLIITLGQTAKFEGPRPQRLGIGKWGSGETTGSRSGQDGTPRTHVWVGGGRAVPHPALCSPMAAVGFPVAMATGGAGYFPGSPWQPSGGIVHAGQVGCFFMNDESV